jgi:periplasmic divalent cation tolerance protein
MAVRKSPDIVVFVTTADEENAAAIGRALVEERLAACANLVGPIRSIYRWQDTVEDAAEHLLIIKTRARLYAALEARIKQLHPYQVPEIIAVKIEKGSAQYLDWIHESTAVARIPDQPAAARTKRSRVQTG